MSVDIPWARALKRLTDRELVPVVERHAAMHNVTVGDVLGRGRTLAVVAARHGVWAELRRTTSLSYPEIATLFGNDHTTVLAGVRKAHARGAAALAGDKVRVG